MKAAKDSPFKSQIRGKLANSASTGPNSGLGKRVSQRKRTKSTRYAGEEYNWEDEGADQAGDEVTQINMADEQFTWDFFYKNDRVSDVPFSGFGTMETVNMAFNTLSRIRGKRALYVLNTDVILEVGHGKFPLVWDMRMFYPAFMYYGVEFSSVALEEAVRVRFGPEASPYHLVDEASEFLRATSPSYFNPDGTSNLELVLPQAGKHPSLWPGTVSIAIGKSFLDYLSSRLIRSVGVADWSVDPRIPQGVVDMFDSVCLALRPGTEVKKSQPVFMMIEPDDPVKFKDHVVIIAKVIYTATFVNGSPSKRFRLKHVHRDPVVKAVCFALVKVGGVYESYKELRDDIYKVAGRLYERQTNDDDWLLPHEVPPKWLSTETKDFDHLTIL